MVELDAAATKENSNEIAKNPARVNFFILKDLLVNNYYIDNLMLKKLSIYINCANK